MRLVRCEHFCESKGREQRVLNNRYASSIALYILLHTTHYMHAYNIWNKYITHGQFQSCTPLNYPIIMIFFVKYEYIFKKFMSEYIKCGIQISVLNINWTSIKLAIFLYFLSQNFCEIVQVTIWDGEFLCCNSTGSMTTRRECPIVANE